MRPIKKIIIHCADTFPDMDIGAPEIRTWHLDRGWSDIGYHFVIKRNGLIEGGRSVEEPGAHAQGQNTDSIGICLVGGKAHANRRPCNFTRYQWAALESLVKKWKAAYPDAEVIGHNDVSSKPCPTFDVRAWWETS